MCNRFQLSRCILFAYKTNPRNSYCWVDTVLPANLVGGFCPTKTKNRSRGSGLSKALNSRQPLRGFLQNKERICISKNQYTRFIHHVNPTKKRPYCLRRRFLPSLFSIVCTGRSGQFQTSSAIVWPALYRPGQMPNRQPEQS